MINYDDLRSHCLKTQQLKSAVIDEFLIYYAARKDALNREAKKKLARYRHVSKKLTEEWKNMIMTQYIAHEIFTKGGYINRYINHSGLDHLQDDEMAFLEFQAKHPWRFSFAEITGQHAADFYEMADAFTGDSYLLFSPGIGKILASQKVRLCFNLISYNGRCWETYGPISPYLSYEPDDIRFFATQVNRGRWFENDMELMEFVESNPMPFMHLFVDSVTPQTYHKDDQIVQITAEYLDDSFNADMLRDRFTIEYTNGVYRISDPDWNQFPHFSTAYYDEREELLFLNSMTDRGFCTLVKQLNSCGYDLSFDPDFRVNMAMVQTTGDILKKEIDMNPYENLFSSKPAPEESEGLDQMNFMLSALIPFLNAGQKPDFKEMSKTYSVPEETVRELYDQLRGKLDS